MPTTSMPAAVRKDIDNLRAALVETIPTKQLDHNLLIGTWNIRAFGGLTDKWKAAADDSPKRDLHALAAITEIVSKLDIVAIQEIKGDIKALRHMLKALGPHWGLILTDVTKGRPGNDERLGFIFDTRRVKMSGLACELVVPLEESKKIKKDALQRQFARTPYGVSFISGGTTFILITLHVIYGKAPADRVTELKSIAEWLSGWAKDINGWDHNLIALGDFNIDRHGDKLYEAFTSTGLQVAPWHEGLPRTIFGDDKKKSSFFDQIAWFNKDSGVPALSMEAINGGNFDFVEHVYEGMEKQELSWRLSDHYPLWVEFSIGD